MKFDEIKKNKDPRTVKPRDPNFKTMQDIKKSGAAGSHGDKTKVIPRKEKYKNKDIKEDGWKDDYKISRVLGKAQASMAHGLELAEAVVKGDNEMAVIKARVIIENWPELIQQLDNIYKDKKDLNSIEEYVDDRVGTVVKTSDGNRVKIIQADPKKGVYKVEFQNGTEVYMTADELDLEVPTDVFGKNPKPRDWKHPWDSDPREEVSEAPIEQDRNDPIAKPYVDKPEWKALHDMDDKIINAYIKHKKDAVDESYVLYDKKTGKRINAKDKKTATAMIAKNKNLEIKGQKWNEDIDSPAHNSYSSMWHKSNPIGRNFMDPDDYDADAEGTHIIMHQPTEQHFYKVPAKNYDEAFDKWLDDRSDKPSDSQYYDSTKDYASDHEYWGRIAPEEPEPDDEIESLTNEEITKILEGDFGVKDLDDYKAKIKTLYGLERYMKSDPDLASEVKKRYRQLAQWKFAYDKAQEENYEAQIYDALKNETATAGATSAGSIATVVNPKQAYGHRPKDKKGLPKAPQKKNPDGTAKNALDISNNLMGGATVKR